jgi:hypothetical protein
MAPPGLTRAMTDDPGRREALARKARETGLTDDEAREVADLERGGPPPARSALLPPRDRERPWQAGYWRRRSLGPLGALLVVLGVVLIVIAAVARRSSIDWRIYEDPGFAFALDYPGDWAATSVYQQGPGEKGPKARRVDGVVFSTGGQTLEELGDVFLPGFSGPAYGLVIYRPAPAGGPPIPVLGSASPSPVEIDGNAGQEVVTVAGGVVTRVAYAELEDRLVMFFVRAPDASLDELETVFDQALQSIRLSEGVEETPATTGPTPRE